MTLNKSYLILCALCLNILSACSTGGLKVDASDFQNNFAAGGIRLNCGIECSFSVGAARPKMRILYNNRLWLDLAKEVARVGYANDQQYFYLGAAAAGMGYRNAARTYFALSNASDLRCAKAPNTCDGFNFPLDINIWLNQLANADAKDATDKKAAAQRSQNKSTPVQTNQQQPSAKPSTPSSSDGSAQPKVKSILDL